MSLLPLQNENHIIQGALKTYQRYKLQTKALLHTQLGPLAQFDCATRNATKLLNTEMQLICKNVLLNNPKNATEYSFQPS